MRGSASAFAVAVSVAVALAGCGDAGGSAGDIDGFRRAVLAASRPLDASVERLEERLSSQYMDRSAYREALHEVDLVEALTATAVAARAVEPPPAYADDHVRWLAWLEESVVDAEALRLAVDNDVLDLASAYAARIVAGFDRLLVEVAPPFCEALTARAESFGALRCERPGDLPGGAYGREANRVARELAARVFPLITAAPLGLLREGEELTYLARIQPDVEAELRHAADRLATLNPPTLLREDHRAAEAYVDGMADVARRITRAAEAGDAAALPGLYEASAEPGWRLEAALGDDGRAVFLPLLPGGDGPGGGGR